MKSILRSIYRGTENRFVKRSNFWPIRFLATLIALREVWPEAEKTVWGRHLAMRGDERARQTAIRRDVHRIEKGLIMRPRRVPFGKDYVPQLVGSLEQQIQSGGIPLEDLAWATDVLRHYFEANSNVYDEWLAGARTQFESLTLPEIGRGLIPTPRSQATTSDISIDALECLAARRRSVRWFTTDPVDPNAVDRALLVAAQSPSACNRQNIRFHLVFGYEQTGPILNTVGGTRGFSHQVPATAVVIGRLAGYRHVFDRHAIYVDGGLASMSFLFALEASNLASCCINWPDEPSRYDAIKEHVNLAPDEQILMLIAIGHADPDGLVPSSHKRGLDILKSEF